MNSTESNLLQQLLEGKTPRDLGFHFPAEWEPHEATWLSWPHKEESWPGKLHQIYKPYLDFVRELTRGEKVHINVNDEKMRHQVQELLALLLNLRTSPVSKAKFNASTYSTTRVIASAGICCESS